MSISGILIQSESEQGVDYEDSEVLRLSYEEASRLIDEITISNSSFYLKTAFVDLDFYYAAENKLGLEVYDMRDGFWGHAEITIETAKSILEKVARNEYFADFVPVTNEEWGAFGRNG